METLFNGVGCLVVALKILVMQLNGIFYSFRDDSTSERSMKMGTKRMTVILVDLGGVGVC